MRLSRRALTAAFLAVSALLTATACRVEQGAALFVGDERITNDRVDALVDSIPKGDRAKLAQAEQVGLVSMDRSWLTSQVVDALTVVELGERVAADTGAKPDNKAGEQIEKFWEQLGMDRDNDFVAVVARAESFRGVLFDGAKPVAPSADEVKEQVDLLETRRPELKGKVNQHMDEQLNTEPGKQAIGDLRKVREYLDRYHVTANPRFGANYIVVARGQDYQPIVAAPIAS